jgi:iron complex outermembrane receptor protein
LGIRFRSFLDKAKNNEIEITGYATIKYFERLSTAYRFINRYGLGSSFRFLNKSKIMGLENEFSTGGDLLYQTGPIEFYDNIGGIKSDILTGLTNETIANVGYYFQDMLELYNQQLYLMLSGRYDKVIFEPHNQLLAAQNDRREFSAFTPKVGLNYKLIPRLAIYSTFGRSFDSPAGNELDNFPTSSAPGKLLNPDLQPQQSTNFEVGIKGSIVQPGAELFNNINFEATVFNLIIDDEVVPFEVYGDVFYRNSARTFRRGLELGGSINIYRGFRSNLAYTYSNFKYDKYIARTITLDHTGQIIIADQDFSGNIPPSIPEHNLSTALIYEQSLSRNVVGFSKLNYRYISGLYVDDANSDKTQAYGLTNITVGLDLTYNMFNIVISGGVDNLFDKTYVGFVNINSASGRFYEAGIPRNYFGTIKLRCNF